MKRILVLLEYKLMHVYNRFFLSTLVFPLLFIYGLSLSLLQQWIICFWFKNLICSFTCKACWTHYVISVASVVFLFYMLENGSIDLLKVASLVFHFFTFYYFYLLYSQFIWYSDWILILQYKVEDAAQFQLSKPLASDWYTHPE